MGAFEWISDSLNVEELPQPKEYTLHPSYPNPFNPITTITYSIPKPSNVNITIYNIQGRVVESLYSGFNPIGHHQIRWDATSHATGVYFIQMVSEDFKQTQKVMLVK